MKRKILFLVFLVILCVSLIACDQIFGENTDDSDDDVCTVTFDSNGGTSVADATVTKGEKITAPDNPTKQGYTFDGWYVGDEKWSFIGYVVTEDMTLTARWVADTYQVRFVDENDNLISMQTVYYGDKVLEPNVPEKSGCVFIGWFNGNMIWSFRDSTVTRSITLKAKWMANIVYVLDGGTNSENNPSIIYSDDVYPMQLYAAEMENYTFLGWYADPNFTQRIDNVASCRSYVLYALWTENGTSGDNSGTDDNDSKYPWDTTNLIFQISENSNYGELPSTSRRYLAGDTRGVDDISVIDAWIEDRNSDALRETNVTVSYQYLPDASGYGWGENISTISEEVKARNPGRPDIYCNFVYDMVATSLMGSFANLLSTTMYEDGHELAGAEHNYFDFTDPTFVDSGEGYMIEYMRSLTLSKYKMYCLSSDYFTDMVRAFLVVPVNIGLLETLQTTDEEGQYNSDRVTTLDKNGVAEQNYTIEDFYQLVTDMDWTYYTLAQFSEAITVDSGEGSEAIDIQDTVGFALGTSSSLPASGMLYTTSITIIDRVYDSDKGDYTYSYPYMNQIGNTGTFEKDPNGTHDELISFCNNLNTLFATKGVIAVSTADAQASGFGDTDMKAIRARFASGNILFGGVICLGALEYEEYKDMNGQGKDGYGIVPVPLYRSGSNDKYLTQIHNLGRIGAISYTTEKFAQCTAYLNYQSTHSTDILNEYYDYKLQYEVVGAGVKGNVEMLKYIRKNVRSSFDKVFEDALGRFYNATDEQSMKKQWHTMIKDNNFQFTDMANSYASVTPVKAQRLYNLEYSVYPTLPN